MTLENQKSSPSAERISAEKLGLPLVSGTSQFGCRCRWLDATPASLPEHASIGRFVLHLLSNLDPTQDYTKSNIF